MNPKIKWIRNLDQRLNQTVIKSFFKCNDNEKWLTEGVLFSGPFLHVKRAVSHHFVTSFANLSRAATAAEQHERHATELEPEAEGHVNEGVLALGERALVRLDQMIFPVRVYLRFAASREANFHLAPVDVR